MPKMVISGAGKGICLIWVVIMMLHVFSVGSNAQSGPSLEGCPVFPVDNVWNTPVTNLPLASNSSAYINTIGSNRGLHPDFGSGTWNGGPIGIPFNVVEASENEAIFRGGPAA